MAPTPIALPPVPKPSRPTKPRLTRAMVEGEEPKPAAAGGWSPSGAQRALGVGLVASLGAMAPVLLTNLPSPWAAIGAGVCTAAALGIAAALGMQSAGPRKVE